MISPEFLRQYPFFSGFDADELRSLALSAEPASFDQGHVFFSAEDPLTRFFLVVEGEVGIILETPRRGVEHGVAAQLIGNIQTDEITISTVGAGHVFGWSSLFPPFRATAAARALQPVKAVVFDAKKLLTTFEANTAFGYKMGQKLARVLHDRLHDRRIESLVQRTN